jgi:hypothetical protein
MGETNVAVDVKAVGVRTSVRNRIRHAFQNARIDGTSGFGVNNSRDAAHGLARWLSFKL